MKSNSKKTRENCVQTLASDKSAFRLITALTADLRSSLPTKLADVIVGKARSRNYDFFVRDLPKLALDFVCASDPENLLAPYGGLQPGQTIDQVVEAIYIVGNYLKKYPFTGSKVYTDAYREEAATRDFLKAEKYVARCEKLYKRRQSEREFFFDDGDIVLQVAKHIIHDMLPRFAWENAVKRAYFGPGVNVGVSWDQTDASMKLYLDKTMTPALSRQISKAAELVPGYVFYEGIREAMQFDYCVAPDPGTWEVPIETRHSFFLALGLSALKRRSKTVRGDRFAVAPKSAVTFRGITPGPSLGSFLQNGIGIELRDIMVRYTEQLNIRDQKRNQTLAYAGASSGMLATIDLTSASGTMGYWLVKHLFPKDWFAAMRLVRSPYVEIRGRQHRMRQMSGMGNGYTFPVETIVFYAICSAAIALRAYRRTCDLPFASDVSLGEVTAEVLRHRRGDWEQEVNAGGPGANREPSVYGDDIVVCTDDAPYVHKALRDCGFWVNRKKSYHTGPFRESCGHDYRNMNYIRPIFLKRPLMWSFDVIAQLNTITDPFGIGWFTQRYNVSFTTLYSTLVDIASAFTPLPLGSIGDTTTNLWVRTPLPFLRAWGAAIRTKTCEDDAKRATYTWKHPQIIVSAKKFREYEDVSTYLKGLLQTPEQGDFSLYRRVVRGEVSVYRSSDPATWRPIFGLDDQEVESLCRRYAGLTRKLIQTTRMRK